MAKRNATVAVIGAGDFIGSAIAKKFAAEGFAIFAGPPYAARSRVAVKCQSAAMKNSSVVTAEIRQ